MDKVSFNVLKGDSSVHKKTERELHSSTSKLPNPHEYPMTLGAQAETVGLGEALLHRSHSFYDHVTLSTVYRYWPLACLSSRYR